MPADVLSHFTVGGRAWHDPTGDYDHDRYPKDLDEARRWSGQRFEWIEEPAFQRIPVLMGLRNPATGEVYPDASDPAAVADIQAEPVMLDAATNRPFEVAGGDEIVHGPTGEPAAVYRPLPHERRILRSDTREHLVTRWESFEIIGVGEMWTLLEALVGEDNVQFEAGGVLNDSMRIWALARLNEPWQAPGDTSETYPFIAFLNDITGNAAAKALYTTIRVVCGNTYGAADAQGKATGHEYVFIHRPGVHVTIDDARTQVKQAMQNGRTDWQAWKDLATDLAQLPVKPRQVEDYVQAFFPYPKGGVNTVSKRVANNIERDRTSLRTILASDTCSMLDDTVYKLVQGTGQWLDHERGWRNAGTLINRTILRPEAQKARAITLAKAAAAGEL